VGLDLTDRVDRRQPTQDTIRWGRNRPEPMRPGKVRLQKLGSWPVTGPVLFRSVGQPTRVNRHDTILFESTLASIASRGLTAGIRTLHLDRAYLTTTAADTKAAAYGIYNMNCPKKRPARGNYNFQNIDTPRNALDRRTNQLLAHQLPATTPQHQPAPTPPTSPTQPSHHHHHHHQTQQNTNNPTHQPAPTRACS